MSHASLTRPAVHAFGLHAWYSMGAQWVLHSYFTGTPCCNSMPRRPSLSRATRRTSARNSFALPRSPLSLSGARLDAKNECARGRGHESGTCGLCQTSTHALFSGRSDEAEVQRSTVLLLKKRPRLEKELLGTQATYAPWPWPHGAPHATSLTTRNRKNRRSPPT